MGFLNDNNFCRFFDPPNTAEFTIDGEFDNGVSAGNLPHWNLQDAPPIGDNDEVWTWISGGDDRCNLSTPSNDWSKGLSQTTKIEKGKIYHFDTRMFVTSGKGIHYVYFLFTKGSSYQQAKKLTLTDNAFFTNEFYVEADDNYNKVMVVVENDTGTGSGGIGFGFYRCLIKQFDMCFYSLPLVERDGLNIFVNTALDNTVDVFSQLKIGLWHDSAMYLPDIATLNQIIISGDNYSMYLDEWVVPVLPSGNFRFVIYDDSAGFTEQLYLSNSFSYTTSKQYTSWVKYNNAVDTLGYLYESAPSFYNEFRMDLWTGRPTFNENVKGHDTYEGDFIQVKADIQKIVEFQTRFLDDAVHEAFFAMLSHSEVLIDDVQYKKTQDKGYEIAWSEDDDNKIGNGAVNLLVVDYSAAVKTC